MFTEYQEILFSPIEIAIRVGELGRAISQDYSKDNPIIVGVLKGSFVFLADLIREIRIPCQVDFVEVSSYKDGTEPSSEIEIVKDLTVPIEGRHVILVDDILDSGNTLCNLYNKLKERNPASIRTAVLLDKPSRRKVSFWADYTGFTISNKFVVGYGLDYDSKYRNLRYIAVLKPEIYKH